MFYATVKNKLTEELPQRVTFSGSVFYATAEQLLPMVQQMRNGFPQNEYTILEEVNDN